jgi:hypothetical protein
MWRDYSEGDQPMAAKFRWFAIRLWTLVLASALFLAQNNRALAGPPAALTLDEAQQICLDADIYGYSLITTEVTRVQFSNVSRGEDLYAPMGMPVNIKRYPPASIGAVSAPHVDNVAIAEGMPVRFYMAIVLAELAAMRNSG